MTGLDVCDSGSLLYSMRASSLQHAQGSRYKTQVQSAVSSCVRTEVDLVESAFVVLARFRAKHYS